MIQRDLRRAALGLISIGFLVACSTTHPTAAPAWSWDPTLEPGRRYFDPDRRWAQLWEYNIPAKVPLAVTRFAQPQPTPATPLFVASRALKLEEAAPAAPASSIPGSNSLVFETPGVSDFNERQDGSGYRWYFPVPARDPFLALDGSLLNGYLFIRQRGESWSRLSRMIYGYKTRAESLRAWNRDKPLKVGSILYYQSPNRPGDTQKMLYIGEDFHQEPQPQRLLPGESLSQLAQRHYNQWRVWREIAFFNNLREAHFVSAGSELFLYPVKLGFDDPTLRQRSFRRLRIPTNDKP